MIVALMHLSIKLPLIDHWDTPGNAREPRRNGTVWAFLFPRGEGELFNFGKHFARLREHTYRIYLS